MKTFDIFAQDNNFGLVFKKEPNGFVVCKHGFGERGPANAPCKFTKMTDHGLSDPTILFLTVYDVLPLPMDFLVSLTNTDVLAQIRDRCNKILVAFNAEKKDPNTSVDLEQSIIKFNTSEPTVIIEMVLTLFETRELSLQMESKDMACLYIWYRFDEHLIAMSEKDLKCAEGTKEHKMMKKRNETLLQYFRVKLPLFAFLDWCQDDLPSLLITVDKILPNPETSDAVDSAAPVEVSSSDSEDDSDEEDDDDDDSDEASKKLKKDKKAKKDKKKKKEIFQLPVAKKMKK